MREHITQNLFGFEYLIAPYTIAHLKLSQYLRDKGHPLKDRERLQVFLTNTLEPIEPQMNAFVPELSHEVEAAQAVKDRDILVIVGNPPYSASSKNKGVWATASVNPYKIVDGRSFGERKHWLHDDYVKFIRFAQLKMDRVSNGVVGLVTNNSFIDNPTFRGMRQSLLKSFDQVFVFDLHGSTRRGDVGGDALDENVFDIEQGVAITLFVKNSAFPKSASHAAIKAKRLEKYIYLSRTTKDAIPWCILAPKTPYYFFRPESVGPEAERYADYISVRDIFRKGVTGIVTARDRLTINFEKSALISNVEAFVSGLSKNQSSFEDTRGWKAIEAREALRAYRTGRRTFVE